MDGMDFIDLRDGDRLYVTGCIEFKAVKAGENKVRLAVPASMDDYWYVERKPHSNLTKRTKHR